MNRHKPTPRSRHHSKHAFHGARPTASLPVAAKSAKNSYSLEKTLTATERLGMLDIAGLMRKGQIKPGNKAWWPRVTTPSWTISKNPTQTGRRANSEPCQGIHSTRSTRDTGTCHTSAVTPPHHGTRQNLNAQPAAAPQNSRHATPANNQPTKQTPNGTIGPKR